MSDADRPARATALVGFCALVALCGLAMLAGGAVMFADLGRSSAGADREGPGLTVKARAIADGYAVSRTAAYQKYKQSWDQLPESTELNAVRTNERREDYRSYAALMKQLKESATSELAALRAGAKEPVSTIVVLGKRPGGGLRAVLRTNDLTGWSPMSAGAPDADGVRRATAEHRGLGLIMFDAPITNGPAGEAWTTYVVYDGIRLMEPGWGPLRTAAQWNGAGLVVVLIGGFGLYFSIRRRRRAVYEAAAVAA